MVVAERKLERELYTKQRKFYRQGKRQDKNKELRSRRRYIVRLVLIVLLAFLPLYRYAVITEYQYRLEEMKSEIKNIELQNERLKVEIANLKSVARIETIARTKLNMQEPKGEQIIYLNTNKKM